MRTSRMGAFAGLLTLFAGLCLARPALANPPQPGDVAVVGLNLDGSPKQFTIVTLADIDGNELIRITDRGWDVSANDGAGGFFNILASEGGIAWQTPLEGVPAGTVMQFSITPGSQTVTMSPTVGGFQALGWTSTFATVSPWNGGGDQILIYGGDETNPAFIYGLSSTWADGSPDSFRDWQPNSAVIASTTSHLPPGLSQTSSRAGGPTAVAFNGHSGDQKHQDNLVYTGIQTGTQSALLTALANPDNWTFSDDTPQDIAPGGANFSGQNPIFNVTKPATQVNVYLPRLAR